MPKVFNPSAPAITALQEQAERNALSDQERQRLLDEALGLDCPRPPCSNSTSTSSTSDDDYDKNEFKHRIRSADDGTSNFRPQQHEQQQQQQEQQQHPTNNHHHHHVAPDPELIQKSLIQLQEAIEAIPISEKVAYRKAMEICPHLVQKESPALLFLQCVNYNVVQASKQLTQYWTVREYLFGSHLAYLPMTLQGAMAPDIQVLTTKPLCLVLPETDEHGRPILYFERIRIVSMPDFSRETGLRSIFYAFQTLMTKKDPWKWGYGWVALSNFQGFDLYQHYDRRLSKGIIMITSCMPFHMKAFHLCMGPGRSTMDIALPIFKLLWGPEIRLRFFHHTGSTLEVTQQLKKFGFVDSNMIILFQGLEALANEAKLFVEKRRRIEEEEQE